MSTTRVLVTGIGATSPLGGDAPSTWSALLAGQSGVDTLKHEWADDLPSQIGAEVAVEPTDVLDRVKARRLDRSSQLALVAALEAWTDAGLDDAELDPERVAVAMASGIGGVQTLLANYDQLIQKGPRRVSPLAIPMLMPNGPAASIGLAVSAKAGVHTPVSACASGNEAIALGIDLIRWGRADVVAVGGTEAAVHALPMAAFGQMRALSQRNAEPQRASRPWDRGRDGFVLGEGAAVLVLESEAHATARNARVYAEAAGAGVTADSHDIAQPDPAGLGATRAMTIALREAGLDPADLVHINAHATSTPQGDVAEALAVRTALGDAVDRVVVTSTKSMTGHLLGAAGALESLATVLALHHRVVPPTINLEDPEDVGLDIATDQRELAAGQIAAMNNSFGFGGHNVAVAFTSV
ncbi:MAG: 3-oxoacyl-[acyl-carrier-protein] synthase, KASII [uncultured Nocardioidaceae bacterium]|uniref:3-oxoacyl-[acyl-carrier-protein] synthase 2 n=1 Tax=uncultured Nocardioidaceae bacterium TaxID=253824 RepID=A0A6J4MDQ6_9ACTN|nr:MAG: 3-oxoacyl-[acyl-carrier-protein] synthase, KASII [uncultured Nocardioidaceae bacterium]